MSDALKQLIEKRATTWEGYQEILARASDETGFSAEDASALDAAESDITRLSGDIERLERAAKLDGKFSAIDAGQTPETQTPPSDAAKRYEDAFSSFVRRGLNDLKPEDRDLLANAYTEFRAQGVATDAAGGYLVPEGFRLKLQETLKAFGGVREVAEKITTSSGNDLPWPTMDDTGNVGAYIAENTQVTEQDVVVGQKKLQAHVLTSKIVRVSFQLLQDDAFDVDSWLPRKLGERIGRAEAIEFTTGDGVDNPEGVQPTAAIGKTGATGQTASVIYDDLVDLVHSVDPAYRNERVRFMLHDLTIAAIRKIKDSTSQPIWQPGMQAGQPSALLGYPLTVNNNMPVMAANARSILFGDFFSGYVVRDVRDVQMLRLTERYADFLQVGFLGFARNDGRIQDAGAYKAYRNSAT